MVSETPQIAGNYEGKYVAYDPGKGSKVIASGASIGVVVEQARKQGVAEPAIAFVPKKGMQYIYSSHATP